MANGTSQNIGKRCSVCDHPNISEVNAILIADKHSLRQISEKFSLSQSSLLRHKTNCWPSTQREAISRSRAQADEDLAKLILFSRLERLTRLERRFRQLAEVADSRSVWMQVHRPDVPGGHTGLLVARLRTSKEGTVEEWAIDKALLEEERAIADQAARELGQIVPPDRGVLFGAGTVNLYLPHSASVLSGKPPTTIEIGQDAHTAHVLHRPERIRLDQPAAGTAPIEPEEPED